MTQLLSRPELIAALEWAPSLSEVRTQLLTKSNVVIIGDPRSYTQAELRVLHGFSERRKAIHNAGSNSYAGCNAILIGKESIDMSCQVANPNLPDLRRGWVWIRKRRTNVGDPASATLVEAMAVIDRHDYDITGRFVATSDGLIGRIAGDARAKNTSYLLERRDGRLVAIHWSHIVLMGATEAELIRHIRLARAERARLAQLHRAAGSGYDRRARYLGASWLEPVADDLAPALMRFAGGEDLTAPDEGWRYKYADRYTLPEPPTETLDRLIFDGLVVRERHDPAAKASAYAISDGGLVAAYGLKKALNSGAGSIGRGKSTLTRT